MKIYVTVVSPTLKKSLGDLEREVKVVAEISVAVGSGQVTVTPGSPNSTSTTMASVGQFDIVGGVVSTVNDKTLEGVGQVII